MIMTKTIIANMLFELAEHSLFAPVEVMMAEPEEIMCDKYMNLKIANKETVDILFNCSK